MAVRGGDGVTLAVAEHCPRCGVAVEDTGLCVDCWDAETDDVQERNRAYKRAYKRAYNQRPDVKERRRAYNQQPDVQERNRAYMRAYMRAYNQRPDVKERRRAYMRAYREAHGMVRALTGPSLPEEPIGSLDGSVQGAGDGRSETRSEVSIARGHTYSERVDSAGGDSTKGRRLRPLRRIAHQQAGQKDGILSVGMCRTPASYTPAMEDPAALSSPPVGDPHRRIKEGLLVLAGNP